jgi:hypothetical protein
MLSMIGFSVLLMQAMAVVISIRRVSGDVVIYATLVLPSGRTSFNQLWQSGLVTNGDQGHHALNSENRNSMGTMDFVTGALAGGGAGGNVLHRRNVSLFFNLKVNLNSSN